MTDQHEETQWFIARDGKQHGPLTDIEMRTFVAHGYLRATDLIWRPGMPEWQLASAVFPTVFQPAAGEQPDQHGEAHPAPPEEPPTDYGAAGYDSGGQFADQAGSQQAPQPDFASPHHIGDDHGRGIHPSQGMDSQFEPHGRGRHIDEPSLPNRLKRTAIAASAAIVFGGGAFALSNYSAPISQYVADVSGGSSAVDVPEIQAPDSDKTVGDSAETKTAEATSSESSSSGYNVPGVSVAMPDQQTGGGLSDFQTAALPPEPEPTTPPSIEGSEIDAQLQKIRAWALIKNEFPNWYVSHIAAADKLVAENKPNSDVAMHLAKGLVELRRQNANKALQASPEKLEVIAKSFLENLRTLRAQSVSACYGFISKGEASPAIVQALENPETATAFNTQVAAIFDAIVEGSKNPARNEPAVKADYDILIKELGKLGWTEEDLKTFSNPRLLSKREPEQVCKMVQDWFVAHLSVSDTMARKRLLYETLKPVVSG